MSKKYLKDLVPLVVICLVAALFLGICNLVTEGPIAANAAKLAEETLSGTLADVLSSAATSVAGAAR